MSLIKVNKNENPYHIIGEYIEKHITYIDDIIAVISIDGNIINELFLVEITTESNFIWQNDWWEGEENVELIDFFFVSDACKRCDNNDLISRQAAIAAIEFDITYAKAINKETGEVTVMFEKENKALENAVTRIKQLPSAQSEIKQQAINSSDCIDRQAAIDIAKELTITLDGYEMSNQAVMNYCAEIMQLPPIQPKRGKWIKNEATWTGYTCSVCGNVPYMQTCMGKPIYDYCPFCGSYNGGEINDQ